MTQLSRPYQIALAALALLVLVWFAALHGHASSSGAGAGSSASSSSAPSSPKPSAAAEASSAAAPTPVYHGAAPGVGGLTRAIDKAHGAVAQSQREAHRVETSEPSASASPTTTGAAPATASHAASRAAAAAAATNTVHAHGVPSAAKPAVGTPSMQVAVEHQLQRQQTVLILFWNRHGSDDVAVHNALPAVQHALGGRVAVHYASAGQVGAFGTITHSVQVTQTPTLLIVNPHGHATVLTGLTDAFAIEQAIGEARHS